MKKFLTSSVPMWRALLAVAVASVTATAGMYYTAKQAIEMMGLHNNH